MKAIVDCNNFYCSCERLFRPALEHKPVVVLSNNDGCIISRSNEAKALGVRMAEPFFKTKALIRQHQVSVFSSNYNLYGDLSWRVMETLRAIVGADRVEVYSVDEAFIDLDGIPAHELPDLAGSIRSTVETWTGIKVSVGVAPTKVLAKVANRLCKKQSTPSGTWILDTPEAIEAALLQTPVEDVWGIGRRYAEKLRDEWGIFDALQLSRLSESFGRSRLGGVTGSRLLRELKGIPANDLEEELVQKKMIATTRMFGNPVGDINSIREAVATYTSRAAEKLRRQHSAASTISVFIVRKDQDYQQHFRQEGTISKVWNLPAATSVTSELIKPALQLAESLFEPGTYYKKAGVLLSNIVPDDSVQANLFDQPSSAGTKKLMDMIDNINFSQRNDVLKFASSGTERNWKMQQNHISGRYTTRWDELFEVK